MTIRYLTNGRKPEKGMPWATELEAAIEYHFDLGVLDEVETEETVEGTDLANVLRESGEDYQEFLTPRRMR